MEEIYLLMFLTGLLGGISHCIGMCGPIVATFSLRTSRKVFFPNLLYNIGRVSTYTMVGAIMGVTGSYISFFRNIEPIQKVIMILAGVLIIIFGLSIMGIFPLVKRIEEIINTSALLKRIAGYFQGDFTTGAFYPMGLVLGLLPCGLVYTAFIGASRVGMEAPSHVEGLIRGGLFMLFFGLGTMPSLMLFGSIVRVLSGRMRTGLYRISGLIIVAMGILFLYRAIRF